MDRAAWDRRYGATDLVWTDRPNRFLVDETEGLAPGRALDVACGEGRNAVWLAARGWSVTGADFSSVALDKARTLATASGVEVAFVEADARTWRPPGRYDLVVLCYLQMPPAMLGGVLDNLVPALAAGGTLLVVGHDRRNLAEGVGGPQDPEVLLDPGDVAGLVDDRLEVERAETVERPVPEADRPALDTLVRARRAGPDRPAGPVRPGRT